MMSVVQKLVDGEPAAFKTLTNNQDRIIFALQWHIDNDLNQQQSGEVEGKNSAKATAYIDAGNIAFSRSLCKDSIEAYCNAVMHAIPGSKELARAYANRSAATFELNMYADSLKDIDRALAIGYPYNLKAKLYVRQAKCLWGLHRKICPEIKTAILNAEKWIGKSNECNRIKLQTALNNMKTENFVTTLNQPEDLTEILSETPADNPKILRASGSIELKYSNNFGRHLVATRDIDAGQILILDKTFISIPSFEVDNRKFALDICWNCSKTCPSGVSCPHCVHANYCDEKCRNEDWDNYHEIDCPVINRILDLPPALLLLKALRMTIKALKEAGSFQGLKDKLCKLDSIADPLEKFFEGNVLDSSKYASVYSLVTDDTQPCPFSQTLCAAIVLSQLCRVTKIFDNEIKKDIMKHKWVRFIGSLLLKNLQIIHSFSYGVGGNTATVTLACLVHPLVALCNHSCDPNVYIYFYRNTFGLLALQKIPSGQQICVSYNHIDVTKFSSKNVRRKRLLEGCNFLCACTACTACTNDWTLSKMKSYKELLPQSKVEKLQTLIDLFCRLQKTSEKTSLEHIALLKEILNTFDATTQNSCAEFYHFKFMLKKLYSE